MPKLTDISLPFGAPPWPCGDLKVFRDETLSSWWNRTQDSDLPPKARDPDYGRVPIAAAVQHGLPEKAAVKAGAAPDAWLLPPELRTRFCQVCLFQDWAKGRPPYMRRAWTVAWRTCCPLHSELFDSSDQISFIDALTSFRPSILRLKTGRKVAAAINIFGDRRAIHLEQALASPLARSGPANWFPKGFGVSSLRRAYAAIIRALLEQFGMDFAGLDSDSSIALFRRPSRNQLAHLFGGVYEIFPERKQLHAGRARDGVTARVPLGRFTELDLYTQHVLNVFAEAIISEWSSSPLPASASGIRTRAIVRYLRWDGFDDVRDFGARSIWKGISALPNRNRLVECAAAFPKTAHGPLAARFQRGRLPTDRLHQDRLSCWVANSLGLSHGRPGRKLSQNNPWRELKREDTN